MLLLTISPCYVSTFFSLPLYLPDSDDGFSPNAKQRLKQKMDTVLESLNRNVSILDSLSSVGRAMEQETGSVTEDTSKL